jgi:hypothetical protein
VQRIDYYLGAATSSTARGNIRARAEVRISWELPSALVAESVSQTLRGRQSVAAPPTRRKIASAKDASEIN